MQRTGWGRTPAHRIGQDARVEEHLKQLQFHTQPQLPTPSQPQLEPIQKVQVKVYCRKVQVALEVELVRMALAMSVLEVCKLLSARKGWLARRDGHKQQR